MSSGKLTNTVRDEIEAAILKHRFQGDANDIVKGRRMLAEAVYNDALSAADRKKIAALPNGWMREASSISFKAGISYAEIEFNGAGYGAVAHMSDRAEHVFRRVPAKMWRSCVKVYEVGHPIAKTYDDVDQRTRDFVKAYDTAKAAVSSALYSVTTTKRLADIWPECIPFLPEIEAKLRAPALPTKSLNAMLGLPVA